MDSFTRKYLVVMVSLLLLAAGIWLAGRDSRVAALNEMLRADGELAGYPYEFRVISLENGVATMSSPRSAQVPVMTFLHAAFPELSEKDVQDPAMMAAQDQLVHQQSRAAEMVQRHAEVKSVRWVLDERWYAERGVALNR
jgi:hypothetical protein